MSGAIRPEPRPSPSARAESIQLAKSKAKAVMAASGLDVKSSNSNPAAQTSQNKDGPSPSNDAQANGQGAGRKRSRSGSRKPDRPAPRVNENGVYPIENEMDKFRFLTFHERDDDFEMSLNSHILWHKELIDSKIRELHWLKGDVQRTRAENPAAVFGPGFMGFGNGNTHIPHVPGRPHPGYALVYPANRPRAGRRKAPRPHISREKLKEHADIGEELVPIRLDVEHEKIKLRDTFTWNLHERLTNVKDFAQNIVEDFKIPADSITFVTNAITSKMQAQIDDYYPHVFITDSALDEQLPYHAYKNDEMRILVKLNITIGSHTLVDQFEWEINNPLNNPEEFAYMMARDLSLSGEFTTAIAHQIREQSHMFTKSLYITSHPFDGRPIEDADVRDNFLPTPISSVFRPFQTAKEFTPYLYELNDADLQREELSILRDQRRQKRSVTRRGGPALPDLKDRERTIRSLVVSSVLPGAAEVLEQARVFKFSRSSGRGRRPGARAEGAEESEESDSDGSDLEAEQTPQIITTSSRGRVIRGAASVAQQAMKANYGQPRSQTPEVSQIHHEPRTVPRRAPVEQPRESSSPEPHSLIVKLKVPPEIFRQWVQNPKNKLVRLRSLSRSHTPQSARASQTPAAQLAKAPSASPAIANTPKPGKASDWTYDDDGRVEVDKLPKPNAETPPIPDWLVTELANTRKKYPHDSFEAFMKLTAHDEKRNAPVRLDSLADKPKPAHIRLRYAPRLRCNDCPTKVYNTGEGKTLENFEIHLRNRKHKDLVEQRRRGKSSG